jgi:hypothetical protein
MVHVSGSVVSVEVTVSSIGKEGKLLSDPVQSVLYSLEVSSVKPFAVIVLIIQQNSQYFLPFSKSTESKTTNEMSS